MGHGKVRGKVMIFPEFLRLGGGTGTRYELNFLLSLPFFSSDFLWSLFSSPYTILDISFAPPLTKVWGMPPKGEGAVENEGRR